jgi:hypothetical protein
MLEILYIYGIEFDRGNTLLNSSHFNSDVDIGKPLYWLESSFYEIIKNNDNDNVLVPDSNLVSNILYIFILYYSDKYDVDFIANEFVNQYFEHQLKTEIYYFIVKFIPDEIEYDATTIEMNYFITKIEKKMKLLMYLAWNKQLYALIFQPCLVDYIDSFI